MEIAIILRSEPRSHRGRWFALAVVLALLCGCGRSTARPSGATAPQPTPRPTPKAEAKPSGAVPPAAPTNRDLMRVQRRLKELGHDPGPIDGIFGARTKAALEAFQSDYGLAATGEIDGETRAALGLGRKDPR